MKKTFKKVAVLLLSSLFVVGSVACGGGKPNTTKPVDDSMTQLAVSNYDGGVGHTWLDEVVARFEADYKDYEFEPGKKGIQIQIDNHKTAGIMGTIASSETDVYFMQEIAYHDMIPNFLDVTDMVTEWTLPGETGTVEDKLSEKTKATLTSKDGKYYALPHYLSAMGLTYNVSLFEEKLFYFADDIANSDEGFIWSLSDKKSCGPDGVYNTADDGLASSLEELEALCDRMVGSGVTPFIWYGKNRDYSTRLAHALWASVSGENGTLSHVSFDSKGEEIEYITDFNGAVPLTEKAVITEANGYLTTRQASKYYALKFAEKIVTDDRYYDSRSLSLSDSHTDAQENFLFSNYETTGQPIAMLLEGTYWENEAKDSGALGRVKDSLGDEEYGNLRYAFMPLPVQVEGRVTEGNGKKQTTVDISNCYALINKHYTTDANIIKAAKMFIQYCYTDISLQNFTVKSGVTKDVNYKLTQDQYNSLTYFQKTAWDLKENGAIINLSSGGNIYTKNSPQFTHQTVWASNVGGTKYTQPLMAMLSTVEGGSGISALDYFKGMWQDANSEWWTSLSK